MSGLPDDVSAIAAGIGHILALTSDGHVYGWGLNSFNQVGDGLHTVVVRTPTRLQSLEELTVASIAAGDLHSLAATDGGDVYAWGSNGNYQLGNSDPTATDRFHVTALDDVNISEVFSGEQSNSSMALSSGGELYAWGANASGQLGRGPTDDNPNPQQVTGLPKIADVATDGGNAGHGFALALASNGTVYSWGANNKGQLGLGSHDDNAHTDPEAVPGTGPDGTRVTAIGAGDGHSLAVAAPSPSPTLDWGYNEYGQLGNHHSGAGADEYVRVHPDLPEEITTVDIAGGFNHSLVATDGGAVWAWGRNKHGQLGDDENDTTDHNYPVQTRLPSEVYIAEVAGGESHSLGRTKTGDAIYAWGSNVTGQLGTGRPLTDRHIPHQVQSVWQQQDGNTSVKAIAAGDQHSMALIQGGSEDGTVWTWGANDVGELGNGDHGGGKYGAVPAKIKNLSGIAHVATGRGHGLAATDTEVYAWGANGFCQLTSSTGDPTGVVPSPQKVYRGSTDVWPDGSTVLDIAAGYSHSLVLIKTPASDGGETRLIGWGHNANGQVGDGSHGNNRCKPVTVDLRSVDGTITGIAGGNSHSLAVDDTGKPYAWGLNAGGQNGHGQIGTGDKNISGYYLPTPVKMDGEFAGPTITEVAAGQYHSLAR